jgi:SET domain-containing protein
MKKLEKYYISDECHIYNFLKLDKDIFKYPNIKIETKLLKYLTNELSSESEKMPILKNISKTIVLFNDLNPISNWIGPLKNVYSNIIKNTKTKYINCILLQYTDLKNYIVRPKNPLVYSKKSTIHGKGIFSSSIISKNTEIMRYIDHIHGHPFMYDDSYLINHSSKHANVFLKYYNRDGCNYSIVVSNRPIHENEELFINYLNMQDMYPWLGGITFTEK